jgi:hypothetical protein
MDSAKQSYDKLREFSSGKEIPYDSLKKGYEIEKLVNLLIKEIVSPLAQKTRVKIGKSEFDGEVRIGNKTMLYQTFAGSLSKFRYRGFLDLLRATYFPYKTYVLIIAQSFSHDDKTMIEDLVERMVTDKVKVSFIDYEVLISLHEFSSVIPTKHRDKDLKAIKKLFLEYLLSLDSIVNRKSFDKALCTALDRLPFEIQEPAAHGAESPGTWRITEQRLRNLENTVDRILREIQNLRRELRSKSVSTVFISEVEEFPETDLQKVKGEGSFPCPKCGAIIDPADETEEVYTVSGIELRNDKLSALILTCIRCGTKIKLIGFIDPASFSPDDKITRTLFSPHDRIGKESIQTYLRSMR